MHWPARLERKLGFLAIPNLTLGVILVQSVAWVAMQTNPALAGGLVLDPALLRSGQWWRVFSFLLLPPASNPIWLFVALYLFWIMGSTLEREWGDFRYTLFWLIGWAASVGFALLVPAGVMTNQFLLGSVYLAFAFLYPDFVVMLFFVLPVKVKWIAAVVWVYYLLTLARGVSAGDWSDPAMILAATLNFFLFLGGDVYRLIRRNHAHMTRKREAVAAAREPFHRCSVCGKTDQTAPAEDFRYARTPGGTRCFCEEHLPVGGADAPG